MKDYFDMNIFTVNINNTSIFSNDSVKKGIDRLMNSPILDFICSMPDSKWDKFQKQFFDYYYSKFKEYDREIGFENLRDKRAKIFNIYDDGILSKDNPELEEKLKNISGCKYESNGDFTIGEAETLNKMKERLLYNENADVKDYLDFLDKYNELKKFKKKTNEWCFLGKKEYQKEIKNTEKDDVESYGEMRKNKYETER